MTDEHRLLLAMHRGHEPSAERLWALLAPRLLAYAATVLPRDQRDAADDVVQQALCSVLDRPRRELKKIEDVTAWLFRITRNAALNHARTEQREHDRRGALGGALDPQHAADRIGRSENADRLHAATAALPAEQRDALLLRLVGGLTLEQAAIALSVNPNTLASRHRAAVLALRATLEQTTPGGMEAEHA
ncbi:MAG: RNA polymerase sigma factor (sigma-70 family) [Phycisphaerales bacterium]|jgi:RNA polymerase sigma factor (sigma-70 family)